jgi:hypothetical protein
MNHRVKFVLSVLVLVAFVVLPGVACGNDRGVCGEGGECAPVPIGGFSVLPAFNWGKMSPRRRMFVLVLLAFAFMAMACTPDPSVPDFNPNPLGDAMGISDILGDVTEHATGH